MKHYFLIAKDVGDLTRSSAQALEERQAKPSPRLARFAPFRRKRRSSQPGDFEVENGRVNGCRAGGFARDPVNLIRLFWSPTAMVLRSILTRRGMSPRPSS